MDALNRTLVEKAGHDFGFEYTVSETTTSLALGSARHPLHAEIELISDGIFQLGLHNAKDLLIDELQRDFVISNATVACPSIEALASVLKRASALAHSLPNQVEQDFDSVVAKEVEKIPSSLRGTEVERLVRQRVGQDSYRRAMLEYWGGACAVSAVAIPEMLRASHAVPWSECETDGQRLDVFNGFLLTANLDALFDRYLISFDKAGYLLVSNVIAEKERDSLGLGSQTRLRWLTAQHEAYLELHRARLRVN